MIGWILAFLGILWYITAPLYWWKKGVPSVLPLPFFGNCLSSLYLSSHQFYQSLYSMIPKAPYIGIHLFTRPVLLLRDPQIILEVLEEKAWCFSSHGMYLNPSRDPMGKSLFHLAGKEWKEARSKLSPQFTPTKVKAILEIGESSIDKLISHIDDLIKVDTSKDYTSGHDNIEILSCAMALSVDLTAAAIFGLESSVFKEGKDSPYYQSAKDLNTPSSMIKALISMVSPSVFDWFRLYSFTPKASRFIRHMVESSLFSKKGKPPIRQDFMDGMVQLLNNDNDYDVKFVVSQGAVLWVGGVETTASALSFALYELSLDQNLQKEVRENLLTDYGKTLVRNIIAETLRKYPVFGVLTRSSLEPCTLSTGLELAAGTLVLIPVFSLHRDPQHFPEPDKFIPGREMTKGAYLPFGAGPRTCLGMRMGQAVLKETLTRLLQRYNFSPGLKCQVPLKFAPRSFFTSPKNGIWLKVERLENTPFTK